MGKSNFADLYINTANSLKTRPQIKVSCACDTYSPSSYYAGIIVYTANGEHTWRAGVSRRLGRSFYVLILRTSEWSTALRDGTAGGVNSVHYYVVKQNFGDKFSRQVVLLQRLHGSERRRALQQHVPQQVQRRSWGPVLAL